MINTKMLIVTLLSIFLHQPLLHADITPEDVLSALDDNLEHPYLWFNEEEKASILERIENVPECKSIMDRLIAECNRYLYMPVETPLPHQLPDSRFDTSGTFLSVYYSYRRAAYHLAFVYQMTEDERYAQKSFEFAEALCDMDTWVIRACQYPKAYPRVSPWNVPDEKLVFTFAIVASDTATEMAAVYDWLYQVLSKEQRDRIKGALLEKAILLVRGNYDYHWWATAYRCNWCAWCNTGLGLAALTLIPEDPRLADVIAESHNRINRTFNEIGSEGGWQEGAAYWAQTVRMSTLFMDALKRATNGNYNMFKHEKISNNPVNIPLFLGIPPHYDTVNFADAHFHRIGSTRLYNKIALETGNPESAWIRNNVFGNGTDIFDILWPRHPVKPKLPETASLHFKSIDWAVMRSDFTSTDKVIVACKAGKNDDPHHGHLDVGQFTVYWQGEEYICDIGTAVYDEKYFDAEKYDTPHASSRGHNLIFVNGEQQISGKLKDIPVDESVGGEILEFRTSKTLDYTLMDPTNAYPQKELKKWRRHIILEKPLITVIVDEVTAEKGSEIEARFHSGLQQITHENYTIIDSPKGDMAIIPVVDGDFSFRPSRHPYLAFQKTAQFKWIPYNGTVTHASEDYSVLAHIILPVENAEEAEAVAQSAQCSLDSTGNYSLSFMQNSTAYEFRFKKDSDGIVLE